MTNKEKAFAIGSLIIFLQRDFHALQAVAEENHIPWPELAGKAVEQPALEREAAGQLVWLQQVFVDSTSDSDLINALHRAFLEEG
jgi:hypothetical protein